MKNTSNRSKKSENTYAKMYEKKKRNRSNSAKSPRNKDNQRYTNYYTGNMIKKKSRSFNRKSTFTKETQKLKKSKFL